MEVAKIQVGGTCACAYEKKTIRAGMVGVTISFAFDEYWDGLNKIAVYRCGGVVRDEYLEGDTGTIPAEVLTKSGFDLEVGVYGTDAEKQIAIPTCWANLGVVRPGADPSGDPAADPSLPIWAQILAKLGNLADLSTEAKENLVAAINEALTKGGGEVDPEEIGRIVDKHLEKNPPAAYTLPIATETTLGGVKAAAATEEMTQPVGITAEGKLVTVPGQNSGGNAALSTAQIEALHGMFKVCAYDDSKDVSGAYAAFKTAFGITDESGGEEEPDTPVTPDEPEKTLSSISATYSGGDVAVGTAVTALTGIVVTARYSDGTSETVTGYTLSGTIAEGSNTVTVSYGGKTTTFVVTGVAESGGEAEGVAVAMLDEVVGGTEFVYYYPNDIREYQADSTNEAVTANGTAFNWYSDEGSTAHSGSITTKSGIPFVTSKNVFEEDTEVKILLQFGGAQHYDSFIIGCTDWDGVSTPSAKNVYNCQNVGSGSWVTGDSDISKDHEITYTVKAGTRLMVASYMSSVTLVILNTDAVIDAQLMIGNSFNYSVSEQVFNKDTTIRITASSTASQHDNVMCGCIEGNSVSVGSHVYLTQQMGDVKWESPYAFDATYTVKAGCRLLLRSYWKRADMDTFSVTEVA